MLSQVINPDDQRGSRVCANQIGQGGVRSSSVGSSTIFFPFLCVCVCVQELKKKKKGKNMKSPYWSARQWLRSLRSEDWVFGLGHSTKSRFLSS